MPALTRAEIESLIPHRPPFLWLDEVTEHDDTRLLARTVVDDEWDVFRGHYPQFPVLPGVLQLEMCFQASAALIAALRRSSEADEDGSVPVVARVDGVKFKRLVRPGEACEVEVTITDRLPGAYYLTGKVRVDGQLACRCDFTTAAAKPAA